MLAIVGYSLIIIFCLLYLAIDGLKNLVSLIIDFIKDIIEARRDK